MKTNWARGLLLLSVAGMELAWAYPVVFTLSHKATEPVPVVAILALYPVAFVFNRLLRTLKWSSLVLRLVGWFGWALAALVMVKLLVYPESSWLDVNWLKAVPLSITRIIYEFPAEVMVLISSAGIWWLARRVSNARLSFSVLVGEFQFGLVILLGSLFVASQFGIAVPYPVYAVAVFFVSGLLGISVAHSLEGRGWLTGSYRGQFFSLLLLGIGAVFALGLVVTALVTPDALRLFLVALKWLWAMAMKVFAFLASLLPDAEYSAELPLDGMPPIAESPENFRMWTIPEPVRSIMRWVWSVLIIGLVLFALWQVSTQILAWLRHRSAGSQGTEHERLRGAFWADLRYWLRNLMGILLRLKSALRPKAKSGPVPPEMASMRQLYREFLKWAAQSGHPRKGSQTPYEYSGVMARVLPLAESDLDFLTGRYTTARYGLQLPTEDELHKARQSWHNIRQSDLRKSKKRE